MKKIVLMCLFGLMFSQTELTTRVYEVSLSLSDQASEIIDIESITGYDLEYAIVRMVKFNTVEANGDADNSYEVNLYLESSHTEMAMDYEGPNPVLAWSGHLISILAEGFNSTNYNSSGTIYTPENSLRFRAENGSMSGDLLISITAEFPVEDEGVGLQGDMNNDNSLNVLDAVILVNLIVEG